MEHFRFGDLNFHKYDSMGAVADHWKKLKYKWSYTPSIDEEEGNFKKFYNVPKSLDAQKGIGSSQPKNDVEHTNEGSSKS